MEGTGSGTVKGLPGINCAGDCSDDIQVPNAPCCSQSSYIDRCSPAPIILCRLDWHTGSYTPTCNPKVIKVTMDDNKRSRPHLICLAGMQIASKVNFVEAKSVSVSKLCESVGLVQPPPTCPDDEAYCKPNQCLRRRKSAQTFNTINEILCKMAQTKYDLMVNKGPYKAQIDNSLCKTGKDRHPVPAKTPRTRLQAQACLITKCGPLIPQGRMIALPTPLRHGSIKKRVVRSRNVDLCKCGYYRRDERVISLRPFYGQLQGKPCNEWNRGSFHLFHLNEGVPYDRGGFRKSLQVHKSDGYHNNSTSV